MVQPSRKRSSRRRCIQQETGDEESQKKRSKPEVVDVEALSPPNHNNDVSFNNNDDLCKKLCKVNLTLRKVHEHVSPKYTLKERLAFGIDSEYGGITGTLTPGSFATLMQCLCGQEARNAKYLAKCLQERENCRLGASFHLIPRESVFCDIGCGTGRPCFYFASLNLRASVGFDIDPMQVFNSCNGLRLLQNGAISPLCSPVLFQQADVGKLASIAPTTHAFAFLGYSRVIEQTALLIARSTSVKLFIAVVLHQGELESTGLLLNEELEAQADTECSTRVIKIPGMKMSGGRAYMAVIIPMTERRRRNVFETLGKSKHVALRSSRSSSAEARDVFFAPSLETLIAHGDVRAYNEQLFHDLSSHCFTRRRGQTARRQIQTNPSQQRVRRSKLVKV